MYALRFDSSGPRNERATCGAGAEALALALTHAALGADRAGPCNKPKPAAVVVPATAASAKIALLCTFQRMAGSGPT